MLRSVCGLATSVEDAHAREHLARCGRCQVFSEQLIAWQEKAGAMLPIPVAEGASPGLIERALHKSAESVSSIKQHIDRTSLLGGVRFALITDVLSMEFLGHCCQVGHRCVEGNGKGEQPLIPRVLLTSLQRGDLRRMDT